ncbi:hypothetical protein FISHEDRAFT_69341 [Fistulina hepatica ATCC 64428]|uniref:Uncharacterized protein n=1 Tax=Fistulina hepatica ATCC 64428 TaxID=1128425 RepID=A0A0D7AMT5_9AGAR|nr:hypothetical protein FISHEDRAFT_69341 [Fistulina hepatica ATCC 64428]
MSVSNPGSEISVYTKIVGGGNYFKPKPTVRAARERRVIEETATLLLVIREHKRTQAHSRILNAFIMAELYENEEASTGLRSHVSDVALTCTNCRPSNLDFRRLRALLNYLLADDSQKISQIHTVGPLKYHLNPLAPPFEPRLARRTACIPFALPVDHNPAALVLSVDTSLVLQNQRIISNELPNLGVDGLTNNDEFRSIHVTGVGSAHQLLISPSRSIVSLSPRKPVSQFNNASGVFGSQTRPLSTTGPVLVTAAAETTASPSLESLHDLTPFGSLLSPANQPSARTTSCQAHQSKPSEAQHSRKRLPRWPTALPRTVLPELSFRSAAEVRKDLCRSRLSLSSSHSITLPRRVTAPLTPTSPPLVTRSHFATASPTTPITRSNRSTSMVIPSSRPTQSRRVWIP